MKTKRRIDKGIIFLILIILTLVITAGFFYLNARTDSIADAVEKGEQLTVAFLFTDDQGALLFTELFFYDPGTGKGAILDIPSETGVVISSQDRIDRIGVLFNPRDPRPYLEQVSAIISQPVPYYMVISLAHAIDLVDLVDGVDIFNANPVEILEEKVLLPSGSLVLDGDKAAVFITYQEEGAPLIEKTDRWEKFTQSLLKSWGEKNEYLLQPGVFSLFHRRLDTNLPNQGLKSFLVTLGDFDAGRMVFQRVLGVERVVDDQTLLFRHKDGALLRETVKQTLRSLGNRDVVSDEELGASLQILNGTPTAGLATRTAQLFQSYGYDVAEVGNSDSFDREYTVVIDRTGDGTRAQRVASVIRCSRIERQPAVELAGDGALIDQTIDVTIILGKDFDGRYCKE